MSFWYLASPYTKYESGTAAANRHAAYWTGWLSAKGISVFSPITHTHPLHEFGPCDMPRTHEFYMKIDKPFMEAAFGLMVLKLPGWDSSKGIKEEIEYFVEANKPIVFFEPSTKALNDIAH